MGAFQEYVECHPEELDVRIVLSDEIFEIASLFRVMRFMLDWRAPSGKQMGTDMSPLRETGSAVSKYSIRQSGQNDEYNGS